ncbi:hypothetical protein [Sphingobium sp. 15-1]|uniref:hypothetical protein n=1 Tax=Sphingobium sp. 15-1 TaxID=2729616 RepID=UPI00159C0EB5|nr:hypothetical protein [Sphingobium sp. 15-1]
MSAAVHVGREEPNVTGCHLLPGYGVARPAVLGQDALGQDAQTPMYDGARERI